MCGWPTEATSRTHLIYTCSTKVVREIKKSSGQVVLYVSFKDQDSALIQLLEKMEQRKMHRLDDAFWSWW